MGKGVQSVRQRRRKEGRGGARRGKVGKKNEKERAKQRVGDQEKK